MDNLTHSLVGLAAAKAGLDRLSPGATTLCVLAANAPDADVVVIFFGDRWTLLQHHRGITHAILGTISLALLIPLLFWSIDWILSRLRRRQRKMQLRGLLLASILVSITHPLMDWTNNYGVRLLLPWNSRWFYGDFVFIVDPFIWMILGSGCFLLSTRSNFQRLLWSAIGLFITALIFLGSRGGNLPHIWLIRSIWLTCLVSLVVLYLIRAGEKLGSRVAVAALVLLVFYYSGLATSHSRAMVLAQKRASEIAPKDEAIMRLAAMPTVANPFRWDCVFETNKATYRTGLNLLSESNESKVVRYAKPSDLLQSALDENKNDRRERIFLGFARFPVARLSTENCTQQTLVQLADLRYTEPGASRGAFSLELPVDCDNLSTSER